MFRVSILVLAPGWKRHGKLWKKELQPLTWHNSGASLGFQQILRTSVMPSTLQDIIRSAAIKGVRAYWIVKMELKKDVIIRAGGKLLTAPNVYRRNGKWYSIIIGIVKNHHAELVIDDEALSVLNAQPQQSEDGADNVSQQVQP
ncbi:MAG: hypothetical protein LLG05_03415 [Porphyromonadaceae bacterium]|nr:hypothetical protein [Porphyromonadaceae bacterium]